MTLAAFWFIVLAVLWTGFLLLEGFDFGVGILHGRVGRDDAGRDLVIRTIGPVWDGNEVWLITAAAATFAAFPVWYATMFSGFYPLLLVVLVALILRGVSFEFRAHSATARGRRWWEYALTGGSVVIPLGLGILLGGLLGGVPIENQEFVGTIGDLFRPYALATGVTVLLVCVVHGAVFIALRTTGDVRARAMGVARMTAPGMVVVVVGFAAWTRVVSGDGVLLSAVEFGAVIAAVAAAGLVFGGREGPAFGATAATMAAVVVSIFSELYPRVMVSTLGPAQDLTVTGAASASYALTVMTVVLALLLPVVLVYQGWTYYVFRRRLGAPPVEPVGPPDHRPGPATPPTPAPSPQRTEVGSWQAFRVLAWLGVRVVAVLVAWLIARHSSRSALVDGEAFAPPERR